MNDDILGYITGMDRFNQHDSGGVITIIPTECRYATLMGPGNPMTVAVPEDVFKKAMLAFASQKEVLINISYGVSTHERKAAASPHPEVD